MSNSWWRDRHQQRRKGPDGRWVSTHPGCPHGTPSGYTGWSCRCPDCSAAYSSHQARLYAERRAQRELIDGRWVSIHPRCPHGTPAGYGQFSCRCGACTSSKTLRVTGDGTRGPYRRAPHQPDPALLDQVRAAVAAVPHATSTVRGRAVRDLAITAAYEAGHAGRSVAAAAGLTGPHVARIARRARDGQRALRRPSGADDDGLITCRECGQRYRSLGPHIWRVHGLLAAEYRARHQLPATTALMATDTRHTLARRRRAAMAQDPDLLRPMRAATPSPASIAAKSAAARAATNELAAVRAARRRGRERHITGAAAAHIQARQQLAAAAGYPTWEAAIADTRTLTAKAAGQKLGCSTSCIKTWRRRLSGLAIE